MDKHVNRAIRGIILFLTICVAPLSAADKAPLGVPGVSTPEAPPAKAETTEDAAEMDLTEISLAKVKELDDKACRKGMRDIDARLKALQREKHGLYRKESELKSTARRATDLPPEAKELRAEIQRLKQELSAKSRQLSNLMNNLDSVKEIRKEHKKLDAEWKRLLVLKDAMLRKTKNLKSGKKGAANADKAG